MYERFFERHLAARGAAVVLRRPAARIGLFLIADGIVRAVLVFKRRQIHERLEGRARLTDHLCRAVELVFAASADHGFDMARTCLDGDERSLRLGEALAVLISFRQLSSECLLRFLLHVELRIAL